MMWTKVFFSSEIAQANVPIIDFRPRHETQNTGFLFSLKNPQLSLPSNSNSTGEGNLIELCMFSNYRVVRNKKPGSLLTLHPVHSSALWYFLSHPLRLLIITTWTLRIYTKGTLYPITITITPPDDCRGTLVHSVSCLHNKTTNAAC